MSCRGYARASENNGIRLPHACVFSFTQKKATVFALTFSTGSDIILGEVKLRGDKCQCPLVIAPWMVDALDTRPNRVLAARSGIWEQRRF